MGRVDWEKKKALRQNTNTESDLYRHYLVNVGEVVGRKVFLFVFPDLVVSSCDRKPHCLEPVLVVHPVECLGQLHSFLPSCHSIEQYVVAAARDYVRKYDTGLFEQYARTVDPLHQFHRRSSDLKRVSRWCGQLLRRDVPVLRKVLPEAVAAGKYRHARSLGSLPS